MIEECVEIPGGAGPRKQMSYVMRRSEELSGIVDSETRVAYLSRRSSQACHDDHVHDLRQQVKYQYAPPLTSSTLHATVPRSDH